MLLYYLDFQAPPFIWDKIWNKSSLKIVAALQNSSPTLGDITQIHIR